MDQQKIGKFIAECRKEKGLTQAQLAEMLGITNRAVSKWENSKSLPDVSIMTQLCEILGVSVNELLKGEKITAEQYEESAEKNLTQIAGEAEKKASQNKILIFVIVLLIIGMAVFSWIAGTDIGSALGEFAYNLSH